MRVASWVGKLGEERRFFEAMEIERSIDRLIELFHAMYRERLIEEIEESNVRRMYVSMIRGRACFILSSFINKIP